MLAIDIVAPHVLLTIIGHSGLHTLYLLLLVAWVAFTGSDRESRIALGLALAAIGFAAILNALTGPLLLSAWISWMVGLVLVWLLAQALVNRQRLLVELEKAQAGLAEQLRLNAELHAEAQRAAVMDERQRLARELHDSATQSLYSARMFTGAASRMLSRDDTETAARHLEQVQQLTGDALAEMRLLIHELRPPVLEEKGLAAALRARLESVEARAGLETELTCDPTEPTRVPIAVEQELYGIAQEALNNALKHAHASRVVVALCETPQALTLEVRDDGVGFALNGHGGESEVGTGGVGLLGMRERATRVGGSVEILSGSGDGTTVRVKVPR
jgi:signal transduction histidine kinase